VGDDDAFDLGLARQDLVDAPRQRQPVLDRDGARADADQFLDLEARDLLQRRYGFRYFAGVESPRRRVGDRAACGDDLDERQLVLRLRASDAKRQREKNRDGPYFSHLRITCGWEK